MTPSCKRVGLLAVMAVTAAFVGAPDVRAGEPVDLQAEWRSQLEVLACKIEVRRDLYGWNFDTKQVYNTQAMILESDRTPVDIVLRRTEALLDDLAGKLGDAEAGYRKRLTTLKQGAKDVPAAKCKLEKVENGKRNHYHLAKVENIDAIWPVFSKACALRREISLANPAVDFDEIVFVERYPTAMGHMCDEFYGRVSEPGGGLFVVEGVKSGRPDVRNLTKGKTVPEGRLKGKKLTPGAFITPDLTYDGERIFFAYSQNDQSFDALYNAHKRGTGPKYDKYKLYFHKEDTAYHLFSIRPDGTELRQLTDGVWNDFYPCVLPSGRVAFLSERRGGEGRCHPRPCPAYVMHSMLPDGSDIVPISYHEINEWSPVVTNDGQIIYTRWDYVDRVIDGGQHPWIAKPDGRDVRALYGNYGGPAGGGIHADLRPVPDSPLFFGTYHGHHSASWGTLIVYDSSVPDEIETPCVKYLTPEVPRYLGREHRSAYATPYPIGGEYFLCVYSPDAPLYSLLVPWRKPPTPHGIYLMDAFGNKTLLYRPDEVPACYPQPLKARPKPPVIPHATATGLPPGVSDPTGGKDPATANVAIMNVYNSLYPFPDDRKVTDLRIVQIIPKYTPGNSRPAITYDGEFVARQVLGTVPVEPDGSAHFIMPAGKPVYFQALDERGLAIQSMRSSAYAMPGETMTCQGCHEPKTRTAAAPRTLPAAMKREPSRIEPGPEGSKPYSFPRLVQPILDAKCVSCHVKKRAINLKADGELSKKVKDLKGWKYRNRRGWHASYRNLMPYAFCYDARGNRDNWGYGGRDHGKGQRSIPGQVGAHVSKLYNMLTTGSHKDKVKLTDEEMERIVTWLDTMSCFYGAYHDTRAQQEGKAVEPMLE